MNGLRPRITKLERTLTDESGVTPGSPARTKYWFAEIDRGVAAEFVNSRCYHLKRFGCGCERSRMKANLKRRLESLEQRTVLSDPSLVEWRQPPQLDLIAGVTLICTLYERRVIRSDGSPCWTFSSRG
jgi:hypothetical protein